MILILIPKQYTAKILHRSHSNNKIMTKPMSAGTKSMKFDHRIVTSVVADGIKNNKIYKVYSRY